MELEHYREAAEQFSIEIERELYLQGAGIKDDLDLDPIFERHKDLFTRDALGVLTDEVERAQPGTDAHRQRLMLLDLAVEGYLGEQTKDLEIEQARREATLTVEFDGRQIPFRQAAIEALNEPDPDRRFALDQATLQVMDEHLTPLAGETHERHHAAARELGFANYRVMCERLKGFDLAAINGQTQAFLSDSASRHPEILDRELRRELGIRLQDARYTDTIRLFRAPTLDPSYPADRLLDSLFETAAGLGLDIKAQANVTLDVESRPSKSPRAFCAPVRVPEEVYLVIAPSGGRSDYGALFHEAGHTEHFAHMDPALPFEFRFRGDSAITEGFAFLFEHLTENQRWLTSRLGVVDTEAILSQARAERLFFIRRYAAKLAYELELHGETDRASLKDRYRELISDAVGLAWPSERYLLDVDAGFYCTCYLRAWALETYMRRHLTERFGEEWFAQPGTAEVLREWWSDGQRLSAEEFLYEATGDRLDFSVLLEDLRLT